MKRDLWLFLIITLQIIIFSSSLKPMIKFSLLIMSLCVILWISEIISVGATGLIPIVLAPLFGITELEKIVTNYSTKTIFLLISGFIIASAVSKWGIDKKITYLIIKGLGKKPSLVVLSLILSTALLSMSLPNTTAAALMIPIGVGILNTTKSKSKSFKAAIILGIAYAASIGGISLIIGTPPNLIAAEYLKREGVHMDFLLWLKMIFPFSMAFLLILWIYLQVRTKSPENVVLSIQDTHLKKGAKLTILVLFFTIFLWVFKALIFEFTGVTFDDVAIGLLASLMLFILTVEKQPLLSWEDVNIPWDVILMFGGGLALGQILLVSGTAEWIVSWFSFIPKNPVLYLLVVSIFSVFATELLSNTALTSTLVPIVIQFYKNAGFNPFIGIITVAVCSAMAFMFPIATPPNAIAFKTRFISFKKMAGYGLFLNILVIFLWVFYAAFVIGV